MSKTLHITTDKGTATLSITTEELVEIGRALDINNREQKAELFDKIIDRFLIQAKQQGIDIERNSLIMHLAEELVKGKPTCKLEAKKQKALMMKMLDDRIHAASGHMKMIFGCVNNLVLFEAYEAIGRVRQSPRYNRQVRHEFLKVINDIKEYNRNLLYGQRGWFSLKKMPEKSRKLYGDISDSDYYDYWTSLGGSTAELCKDELNVLLNKFKLSMEAHQIQDAALMARLMLVCSLFDCAEAIYTRTVREFKEAARTDWTIAQTVWHDFSMERLKKSWERAMLSLSIKGQKWEIEENENRNITLTIDQLCEKFNSLELYYESTFNSTEDYEDIFRTKGSHKKALREIAERMEEAIGEAV